MEFDLIEQIRERLGVARDDVVLGIGDDAALLAPPPGQELAVALDTMVAGTHFLPDTDPRDLGWKILAVNLSDLAAMGAVPTWAVLGLTMPRADHDFVTGLATGFAELARPHRLALVGGDTTSGPLCLSLAVHGFVPPGAALTRQGARPGDLVMVTGALGEGAAGLACLRQYGVTAQLDGAEGELIARVRRPQPRLAAGLALRGQASACIDVSDGLLADLGHICRQSEVGAELELPLLPISPAVLEIFAVDQACDFALAGGDDYELCFTVPESRARAVQVDLARTGIAATRIGRIVPGQGGVRLRAADGVWVEPRVTGWQHFAS